MGKKISIVCADPPYNFEDHLKMSSVKRGADANYSTMSIDEICKLDVQKLADPKGSVLALWVPSSLLNDGIKIMESWGFSLKQTWIWVKIKKDPFKLLKKSSKINWESINWEDFLSFGMGRLGRNVHEIVLVGTMGKVYDKLKNKSQRTVFFYQNTKHSQKPELLQDKLDLMFPEGNKLEIFGRRLRKNWTVIGNECPSTMGEDVRESIKKLIEC